MKKFFPFVLSALCVFALNSVSRSPAAPVKSGKRLRLAVIPKGTTHEFWKAIHAGAVKAQQELKAKGRDVEIIWKGPLKEDDRNGQIDVVENFRTQKVDGIALAPLDAKALARPAEDAIKAGIPLVVFDSDLDSKLHASFIATDNKKGGALAAAHLAKLLNNKGRVILMRYQVGSASTENREAGFLEGIKKFPNIKVISDNQHAGATRALAQTTAQNLLNRFGKEVDGIFTPNESSADGMQLALKEAKLLGKVKFVGFDFSPTLNEGLKQKNIHGLVLQDPVKMCYLAVMTLVKVIDKQKVDKFIDTGVYIATPDNMNTPQMKDLMNPPIDRYLK